MAHKLQQEKEKRLKFEREQAALVLKRRTMYCNATVTEIGWAAEKGAYGRLKELIDGGANINQQDPRTGKTALHIAIANERTEEITYLRRAGARLDILDSENKIPMDYCRNGKLNAGNVLPSRPSRPSSS
jgi:ankyrin repeat protein